MVRWATLLDAHACRLRLLPACRSGVRVLTVATSVSVRSKLALRQPKIFGPTTQRRLDLVVRMAWASLTATTGSYATYGDLELTLPL